MTPERALGLLDRNTHNRAFKRTGLQRFEKLLSTGHWHLTWDAVAISDDGTLLNGQHRLWAIVQTGISAPVLFVSGLPAASQNVGDSGIRRQIRDQLQIAGAPNPKALAAVARLGLLWETTGSPLTGRMTVEMDDINTHIEAHPEIHQAVELALATRKSIPNFPLAMFGVLLCHLLVIDGPMTVEFVRGVSSGQGLSAGDPRLVLRNRVISQRRTRELGQAPFLSFAIRAWNAYRKGEAIVKFQYNGGALPAISGEQKPRT